MNNCNEFFHEFVEYRVQDNIKKLLHNENYINDNSNYNKLFEELLDNAMPKEKKKIEDMCDALHGMNSEEVYLAYKIGFIDGIHLNNYVKSN